MRVAGVRADRQSVGVAGLDERLGASLRRAPYVWLVLTTLLYLMLAGCDSGSPRVHARRTDAASTSRRSTTTIASLEGFPPIRAMTVVSDGHRPVGYAPTARLIPRTSAAFNAMNARTLVPVTLADGTLVGYEADAVGFISLAAASRPGFDVEALRAQIQGGCEPQIGDPAFKQEFPLCPPISEGP